MVVASQRIFKYNLFAQARIWFDKSLIASSVVADMVVVQRHNKPLDASS